jgi:hypothetical protein
MHVPQVNFRECSWHCHIDQSMYPHLLCGSLVSGGLVSGSLVSGSLLRNKIKFNQTRSLLEIMLEGIVTPPFHNLHYNFSID